MHQALGEKGIPSDLEIYPNQDHGFSDVNNIAYALDRELAFYQLVFAL